MEKPYIINEKDGWLSIGGLGNFSVFRTFDCGQCFRFDPVPDGKYKNQVAGVARGRYVSFADGERDGEIMVYASPEDFEKIWYDYLALDADYEKIDSDICLALSGDGKTHMERAVSAGRGIRILRQDGWEALCSFIVSQNNNIPRIKKIISEMCRRYGEKIDGGYTFPTAETLYEAGEAAIFDLRTGFRAKYIYDAAKKVACGEISLDAVRAAQTYDEAAAMLENISGVGPKVAACTLLFGFDRTEAFPIDVWMKRVAEKRFPNGLDHTVFGKWAGIAQQYLFYYERYIA